LHNEGLQPTWKPSSAISCNWPDTAVHALEPTGTGRPVARIASSDWIANNPRSTFDLTTPLQQVGVHW